MKTLRNILFLSFIGLLAGISVIEAKTIRVNKIVGRHIVPQKEVSPEIIEDTLIIKGQVFLADSMPDGSMSITPCIGGLIRKIHRNKEMVSTDVDGSFRLKGMIGDSLCISYPGYGNDTVIWNGDSLPPVILRFVSQEDMVVAPCPCFNKISE